MLQALRRRPYRREYVDLFYRGYWGFKSVKTGFANYPNYMIWDDHEIVDGVPIQRGNSPRS